MGIGALGWRGVAVSLSVSCALACGATTRSDPGPGKVEAAGAARNEPSLAAGRAASEGGAGSPSVPEPVVEVSGRWAQFGTDDANAAELVQTDGVLTGNGCIVGLPTPTNTADSYCGAVHGQIEGARATFAYDATIATEGADLWVSSDGQRMAGRHAFEGSWFAPVTWLRIAPTDSHLPLSPTLKPVSDALGSRKGSWVLTQLEGPEPLFLGRTDLGVVLNIQSDSGGLVLGTLGAFWVGEMRWSDADSTLEIGPVPETVPGVPVQLRLHFDAATLQAVETTLPNGERQRFSASMAP
jgi:hypothetical protein